MGLAVFVWQMEEEGISIVYDNGREISLLFGKKVG